MKFFSPIGSLAKINASIVYRIEYPYRALERAGYPIDVSIDDYDASVTQEQRWDEWTSSDLVRLHNPFSDGATNLIGIFNNMHPASNGKEIQWPPTIIVDSDDAGFDVSPFSKGFREFGYKDTDGRLLQPGDKIEKIFPGEDFPRLLWTVGKDIDIKANMRRLAVFKKCIETAPGMTVSTPYLKEYYKKVCGREDIFVLPNTPFEEDFCEVELADHSPKVRILWQGSNTHFEDLWEVQDVLVNVVNRYPNVELVLWGSAYGWLLERIKSEQIKFLPWSHTFAYRTRYSTINADINLAPLAKTIFAATRSGIKWYEASLLPKPMPTLARNFGPYTEIEDGKTGLTYDTLEEFETKLCTLIENATLRKELASNAKDWMHDNRDPVDWAHKHWEYMMEVRDKFKNDRPYIAPPTEEEVNAVNPELSK